MRLANLLVSRCLAMTMAAVLVACDAWADGPSSVTPSPTVVGADSIGVTPPDRTSRALAPNAIVSRAELAGEYRVAGIDGVEFDLPHAMTVTITPGEIRYASQCVTGAWRYRFEGSQLALRPIVEAVCDRGRYPEEEAIDTAIAAARDAHRTASNGVELSGGGHSVLLFSQ